MGTDGGNGADACRILILDLYPSPCSREACSDPVSLIRDHLSPHVTVEISRVFSPKALSPTPAVILFRLAPIWPIPQALRLLRSRCKETPILGLFCPWRPSLNMISEFLSNGLDDYLFCPFNEVDLIPRLGRLVPDSAVVRRRVRPHLQTADKRHFGLLIGNSDTFLKVVDRVPRLTSSNATILISGETGTGKELFARAIHYHSQRQGKPFIAINCAALPDHLLENELFGHSKGAYTDASSEEKGLLAEAEGGTLFLDEINVLSPVAQAKLLRFLQDREYRPLGSSKSKIADVRIIAATNVDLNEQVQAKLFREDLFHRLNVLAFTIPPLRERNGDVTLLAEHFLAQYAAQYDRGRLHFSEGATQKLWDYHWPGNVRELDAVIHRAVLLAMSDILTMDDLDISVPHRKDEREPALLRTVKSQAIEQFERTYLIDLLRLHQGNISRAAKSAGKERRTFQRLVQKYGLDRHVFHAQRSPNADADNLA